MSCQLMFVNGRFSLLIQVVGATLAASLNLEARQIGMRQPINQAGTTVIQPSIEEEQRVAAETAAGQRWKVIAHDDNFTTMEFVVRIMVQIFKKPLVFAEAIMWQVHNEGLSVVDVLPKAEAEHRVRQATAAARLEGFPFRLTIEPDE